MHFQVKLEFGSGFVFFVFFRGGGGGRKTRGLSEKLKQQERELTTNSTHIWHQLRESNPGVTFEGEGG